MLLSMVIAEMKRRGITIPQSFLNADRGTQIAIVQALLRNKEICLLKHPSEVQSSNEEQSNKEDTNKLDLSSNKPSTSSGQCEELKQNNHNNGCEEYLYETDDSLTDSFEYESDESVDRSITIIKNSNAEETDDNEENDDTEELYKEIGSRQRANFFYIQKHIAEKYTALHNENKKKGKHEKLSSPIHKKEKTSGPPLKKRKLCL